MLSEITPLLLTHNEAPNIRRTVERLAWASDIVVVDSGSTDETRSILREFPRIRVFERNFTTHAEQWNFALQGTGVCTEWVLALDADYVLSDAFIRELETLEPDAATGGYRASFKYCINGKPLRGAAYPPVVVLFRRNGARYVQDGHTQRVHLTGEVRSADSPVYHDDRKPLDRWYSAQLRYMRMEAEKLRSARFRDLGFADRLRRLVVFAPAAMLLYCLIVKRGFLDGRAGFLYAMQRAIAEMILSRYLLRGKP